ncbi:GNAT family N-acetyltransferase [Glutamicibacter sp. ZJUTW]|uniref:GNAT family N-acetyltransferase n=1 Tax=Glutamicibacter sp. ZJUTW TaxID=1155384 RepID=UPI0011F2E680|nr:GNAT family N-acetyltransferase [Glutamicibacter sp. ZJUTW]QEP07185.1 GNAT family N-acetyltransferase [Glutamicibacter sp. ZJUTW]
MELEILPADASRWDGLALIFGVRGDPSWCKCQYFIDEQWNRGAASNDTALREQVSGPGIPAGLLAYADGQPAGWVQVGPSGRYPRFRPRGHQAGESIWVLTCFVIRPEFRRQGISAQLLAGAIEHARANGASVLRARPTDTSINAKDSAGLFTGVLATFEAAGFTVVNRNRSLALVELDLAELDLAPTR